MGTDFPDEYQSWSATSPVGLFDAPIEKKVPKKHEDVARNLEKEVRSANWLILWLDCDREGENIAFEVIQVCTKRNPRLKIYRAHFSSLVPREIHDALRLNRLTPPDEKLSDAVDARLELDLRIGYSFTRFQTMRIQNRFVEFARKKGEKSQPISYGPCQFPTLGFVVDRYWKRKAFRSEKFWCSVLCLHFLLHAWLTSFSLQDIDVQVEKTGADKKKKTVDLTWDRGRLFDTYSCVVLAEMCAEHPEVVVTKINSKPAHKLYALRSQSAHTSAKFCFSQSPVPVDNGGASKVCCQEIANVFS